MPRIVTHVFAFAFPLALATLPLSAASSAAIAKPSVEVAFVLDTTGSMGGLIEGAKRKIWSIATAIVDSNPDADIRMGLVAYRDIGDDYVTRTFDLTTDIQDLYANLLELKARGGGDWPESVNEALDVTVNKLHWTPNGDVKRIVFLVGDAPPHMDYAQDTKYPVTLAVAKQKDIIVNAVLAGDASAVTLAVGQLPESVRRAPERGSASIETRPSDNWLTSEDEGLRTSLDEALRRTGGNVSIVAREMGKTRMQIHRWMKRYGIDVESYRHRRDG